MNQATQKGAASNQQPPGPDVKPNELPVETRSPRDIQLEEIEQRQEEARRQQINEDLSEDPGAAAMQARIEQQQDQNRADAEAEGLLPPAEPEAGAELVEPELKDGAASVEEMYPESTEPKPLPKELQNDPLADYIVMDKENPMFVMKVNGENLLLPLEEARRKLQIGTAAEIRMQNAAAYEKDVQERERKVKESEEALRARVTQQIPPAPAATPQGLSEEDIRKEATTFVTSAFSEDEDSAADKLTKLLMKVRTPVAQAPAPRINEAEIINRAATAAVGAISARDRKQDLAEGYNQLKDEYPEIFQDANLYNMTDKMVDEIATEHPDWKMSQAMLEAGKRTREWVEGLKGTTATVEEDEVEVTTEDEDTASKHTQPPNTQLRQDRKSRLVRMPQTAASAVSDSKEPEERPQSPAEALNELRASRGQPT